MIKLNVVFVLFCLVFCFEKNAFLCLKWLSYMYKQQKICLFTYKVVLVLLMIDDQLIQQSFTLHWQYFSHTMYVEYLMIKADTYFQKISYKFLNITTKWHLMLTQTNNMPGGTEYTLTIIHKFSTQLSHEPTIHFIHKKCYTNHRKKYKIEPSSFISKLVNELGIYHSSLILNLWCVLVTMGFCLYLS